MRFSIAASVLRNALAISFTLKPHKTWSTSATCASSGSRGWQQENLNPRVSIIQTVSELVGSSQSARPLDSDSDRKSSRSSAGLYEQAYPRGAKVDAGSS